MNQIRKQHFEMNRILDKKPVNTSRQGEFDYLKGIFMLFIFVMGMGTVYSKHSEPKTLAKNGIVMVGYQYLNNIACIAALTLPYLFIRNALNDKQIYYDLVTFICSISIYFL